MTNQDILDYHMGDAGEEWYDGLNPIQEMRVKDAMEQYAQQEAVAFAKFAMAHTLQDLNGDEWFYEKDYGKYEEKTDGELYELYLKSKETT